MDTIKKNRTSRDPAEFFLLCAIGLVLIVLGFLFLPAKFKTEANVVPKPPCTAAFRGDLKDTSLLINGKEHQGKLKILDHSRPYYVAFNYHFPQGATETGIEQLADGNSTSSWSVTYTLSNTLHAFLISGKVEWPECDETVLVSDFTATLP